MPEFKLAAVGLTLWYLIPALWYEVTPSPLLEGLKAVRREFQLGGIESSDALRRVEEEILGEEIGVVLARYFTPITHTLATLETQCTAVEKHFEELSKLRSTIDLKRPLRREIEARAVDLERTLDDAKRLLNGAGNRVVALRRRLRYLGLIAPTVLPDILAGLETLTGRINVAHERWTRLDALVDEVFTGLRAALSGDPPPVHVDETEH